MLPEESGEHGESNFENSLTGPLDLTDGISKFYSALEFVKQGASGLILHYLGDTETTEEIESLRKEVEAKGARAVTIPGDIAILETSKKVRVTKISDHDDQITHKSSAERL